MQAQQNWKGKRRGSSWNRQRHGDGSNISIGKRKDYLQGQMLCRLINAQEEALENAYEELEVERDASATAMDEAMFMLWRLQHQNARLAMEASHLKRECDHKMAYAQEALNFYEEMLMFKDEEIRALESELTSYRKRDGIHSHEANASMDKAPRDPLEGLYQETETGVVLKQDDVGFQDEESCVECDKFVVIHERAAATYGRSDDNDVLPWGGVESLEKPSDAGSFLFEVDGCPIVCTPREPYTRLDVLPDEGIDSELINQAVYSFARNQMDAGSQDIVGQEEECYREAMAVKKLESPKGEGFPSFVKTVVVGAVLGYVGKMLTCKSR